MTWGVIWSGGGAALGAGGGGSSTTGATMGFATSGVVGGGTGPGMILGPHPVSPRRGVVAAKLGGCGPGTCGKCGLGPCT